MSGSASREPQQLQEEPFLWLAAQLVLLQQQVATLLDAQVCADSLLELQDAQRLIQAVLNVCAHIMSSWLLFHKAMRLDEHMHPK